jgi:Fur family ferric uptake transcriptional regulator
MEYKTKQREIVLEYLKSHPEYSLSAKEIKDALNNEVSKATLYRTLDKLEEEHILRKYYNEFTSNYEYQYAHKEDTCSSHLHLKCTQCGRLIHLHCKEANELINHISKEHDFFINQENTIIYGICSKCSLVRKK